MNILKVGDKVSDFSSLDQHNNTIKLTDFSGKKLIVFFYPRASTPGCTAQACNLSENYDRLSKAGYTIYGVSADQVKHQASFSNKFGFPYPLLADTEKTLVNSFGVWGFKKFMGKEYEGILRTTFVFDENCIITRDIEKVKTKDHTSQILDE